MPNSTINRRGAIIASLLGILPILGQTQKQYGTNAIGTLTSTEPSDPSVAFFGPSGKFEVGWALKTMELVVRADGREVRIPQKKIMDALEGRTPDKDQGYYGAPHFTPSPDGKNLLWAR